MKGQVVVLHISIYTVERGRILKADAKLVWIRSELRGAA